MQRSDELPPAPGEAHSGQPVDLEYTALPLGDEQRVLLAHDRRLAEYVVSRDAPAQRILRTASTHEDPSLAIQLELRALRQLRRAARAASARRLGRTRRRGGGCRSWSRRCWGWWDGGPHSSRESESRSGRSSVPWAAPSRACPWPS